MKKYLHYSVFFLFAIPLIAACDKEVSEFTDSPVIESYLVPGDTVLVCIERQTPFEDDVQYSDDLIENLDVTLIYNNSEYTLTHADSGKYISTVVPSVEGGEYELVFEFNGKTVSAYTYIPSKPVILSQSVTQIEMDRMDETSGPPFGEMPDPVSITWKNNDGSYYLLLIENIEEDPDPIRDFKDDDRPEMSFRTSPTTSDAAEINAMNFQYFGTHRIILYHVLPDYASLYEQNGTSSLNLTNPSTSIVNAYGIFTGLNTDTVYLEVIED